MASFLQNVTLNLIDSAIHVIMIKIVKDKMKVNRININNNTPKFKGIKEQEVFASKVEKPLKQIIKQCNDEKSLDALGDFFAQTCVELKEHFSKAKSFVEDIKNNKFSFEDSDNNKITIYAHTDFFHQKWINYSEKFNNKIKEGIGIYYQNPAVYAKPTTYLVEKQTINSFDSGPHILKGKIKRELLYDGNDKFEDEKIVFDKLKILQ